MKRFLPFLLVLGYLLCLNAAVRAQDKQPHRCTCGCEVSGQCKCPNCSVGCGFLKPPVGNPPWTPVLAQAPAPPAPIAAPANVTVFCAFDASITIDGQPTYSRGVLRHFTTAPFVGQGTLTLVITNGQRVATHQLTVTAGQTSLLTDFGSPAQQAAFQPFQGIPPGPYYPDGTRMGFQGFQGGGCANGQCGGTRRGR